MHSMLKCPKVPKSQKSQCYIKRGKRGNSLIINDSIEEYHPLGLWDFGTFVGQTDESHTTLWQASDVHKCIKSVE